MVDIRVRGIYATAIAKILLEKGHNIVHASKKIRERFKLEETRTPPQVTVKDVENKHGIIVLGDYKESNDIYNVLLKRLPEVFSWKSKIPHHAIVKGVVIRALKDKSIVDLGKYRGELDEILNEGEEVIVDIGRPLLPPSNTAKLSRNYTIHGKYSALIYGLRGKVIVSRHIVDPKTRRNLQMLANLMKIGDNWGIKWRSSATLAKIDDLMVDVQETLKKAEEILKKAEKAKPGEIVYEGRFFGIIGFTSQTRKFLDEIRDKVTPTLIGHHTFKSMDNSLVSLIDYSEHLLARNISDRNKLSEAFLEYLVEYFKENRRLEIEHISLLNNDVKTLTPGTVMTLNIRNEHIYGIVKRVLKGKGVLDGLNVSKEKGDYDLMEFSTESYILIHKYYSKSGAFKGTYLNINTPPEISCGKIRYYDLEADVVVTAEGEAKIIDEEKLRKTYEEGIIDEEQYSKYMRITENLLDYVRKQSNPEQISLEEILENIEIIRAKLKNT